MEEKVASLFFRKKEIMLFDYHASGEENTLFCYLQSEEITCITKRACELVYLQFDERALVI